MTQPIAPFLPHTQPMVLLDHLLAWDEESVTAEVTVHRHTPFAHAVHGVPAHVALEWMAQACAAYAGLRAHADNRPVRIGFLLGTRDFIADLPWFAIGDTVHVSAHRVYLEGGMAVFDCSVRVNGVPRARAKINVYQPDDIDPVEASV